MTEGRRLGRQACVELPTSLVNLHTDRVDLHDTVYTRPIMAGASNPAFVSEAGSKSMDSH